MLKRSACFPSNVEMRGGVGYTGAVFICAGAEKCENDDESLD